MPENYVNQRAQVLTQKDLEQLALLMSEQLQHHPCKFGGVTHEQMDKMVRLSDFFERFEKKVMDGISYAALVVIGGIVYLLYNHGYLVKK